MLTTIFSIIKAAALLTYAVMIVLTWLVDRRRCQEFFKEHKVIQATVSILAILGGVLFVFDVATGKIV